MTTDIHAMAIQSARQTLAEKSTKVKLSQAMCFHIEGKFDLR